MSLIIQHITGSLFLFPSSQTIFVYHLKYEDIVQVWYIFTTGSYYDIREFKDVIEVHVLGGIFLSEV